MEDIIFDTILVEFSGLGSWFDFDLDNKQLHVKVEDQTVMSVGYHKPIDLNIDNSPVVMIMLYRHRKKIY